MIENMMWRLDHDPFRKRFFLNFNPIELACFFHSFQKTRDLIIFCFFLQEFELRKVIWKDEATGSVNIQAEKG